MDWLWPAPGVRIHIQADDLETAVRRLGQAALKFRKEIVRLTLNWASRAPVMSFGGLFCGGRLHCALQKIDGVLPQAPDGFAAASSIALVDQATVVEHDFELAFQRRTCALCQNIGGPIESATD